MKKIWRKQDWKDLYAINYRFQALAKKICKTHAKVLTKLIKLGVRSVKGLRLDLDAKNLIDPGFNL
jgi:hypothetical protein